MRYLPANRRSAGSMGEKTAAFFMPPCRSQAGRQGRMLRARQGAANPVKRGAIEEAPFPEEQAGSTLPSAFRSPLDWGRLSVMVLLLIDDK
ncbi:hypothetical protein [Ralstonia pseudosolanacearum]|uniref:hypothetical protein n=2 Tax=Ralstonia pseudosolanacearum TaxID=1310165 RepID=UPI003AB0BA0F